MAGGFPALAAEMEDLSQTDAYDSYFDDALFIGDSLFQQLHRLVLLDREAGGGMLGTSRFLYAASYTLYAASLYKPRGDVQLRLRGQPISVVNAASALEAGKLVFLLGHNDHAGNQLKKDLARFEQVVDRVREARPGITFIAVTITPVHRNGQDKTFNQKNLDRYNAGMADICQRKGVALIDMASPLKNSEGFLNAAYCNDQRVHLTEEGLMVMLSTLRRFARDQMASAGTLKTEGKTD